MSCNPAGSSAYDPSVLRVEIDSPLPRELAIGRGTAILIGGSCFDERRAVRGIELRLADRRVPAIAYGMPRPDQRRQFGGRRAYLSGFWGIVPVVARAALETAELTVVARLEDGSEVEAPAAELALVPQPTDTPSVPRPAPQHRRIAICMATFEPEAELLRRQLDSIRAQTRTDWTCLISDDGSSDGAWAAIKRLVAGDERFIVSRSERRLGFYANFERALRMVPAETEHVALSDQDDYWYPEKLEALVGSIGDATLAYSDARVTNEDGSVESDTYWSRRRNNYTDLGSMILANSISGAASLFRRELLDLALPFPPAHARFFHDHWLAVVALAAGRIAYVDRPLYDYVQHRRAALGHEAAQVWATRQRGPLAKLELVRRDPQFFYEHWRTTYFTEYCRAALFAEILQLRCGERLSAPHKAILRRLRVADRSPAALAWLAARRLRALVGPNETLNAEGRLLRAALWRQLLERVSTRLDRPRAWSPQDGSVPSPFSGRR